MKPDKQLYLYSPFLLLLLYLNKLVEPKAMKP